MQHRSPENGIAKFFSQTNLLLRPTHRHPGRRIHLVLSNLLEQQPQLTCKSSDYQPETQQRRYRHHTGTYTARYMTKISIENSPSNKRKDIPPPSRRDEMNADISQLRPTGTGFVVAPVGDGLPTMRRLVESFTGKNKKSTSNSTARSPHFFPATALFPETRLTHRKSGFHSRELTNHQSQA